MCIMNDTHHWRGITQSHAFNLYKVQQNPEKKKKTCLSKNPKEFVFTCCKLYWLRIITYSMYQSITNVCIISILKFI